jgi:hypothetical protein
MAAKAMVDDPDDYCVGTVYYVANFCPGVSRGSIHLYVVLEHLEDYEIYKCFGTDIVDTSWVF